MSKPTLSSVLMCQPDHFAVTYQINPWMQLGSTDQGLALLQWEKLVETLKNHQVSVEMIPQRKLLPDMVFTADHGIVKGKQVLLSSFRHWQRREESQWVGRWFEELGFFVHPLPDDMHLEGGDCLQIGNRAYVGVGFRTTMLAATVVEAFLGKYVTTLELVDEKFYHLDTCFFPLSTHIAFYYPPAFSLDSQKQLEQHFDLLIPFTDKEAFGFCANSVVIGDSVLVQAGNASFTKTLQDLSYRPLSIDMSEFIKAGGGIHCLMLPLITHSVLTHTTRYQEGMQLYASI